MIQINLKSTLIIPPITGYYDVCNSLLQQKQSGTRGLDDLDGNIIELCAPVITDALTYIYTLCIDINCFPKAFKQAKVIPL